MCFHLVHEIKSTVTCNLRMMNCYLNLRVLVLGERELATVTSVAFCVIKVYDCYILYTSCNLHPASAMQTNQSKLFPGKAIKRTSTEAAVTQSGSIVNIQPIEQGAYYAKRERERDGVRVWLH